jgi:hypothetical protein
MLQAVMQSPRCRTIFQVRSKHCTACSTDRRGAALKLVQTLVALVSASDTREVCISQPLSTVFVLFCSSKYPIIKAAQRSHALNMHCSMHSTPCQSRMRRRRATPRRKRNFCCVQGRMSPLGGQLLVVEELVTFALTCSAAARMTPKAP